MEYNFKGTITLIGTPKDRKGYTENYVIVSNEGKALVFFVFNSDIYKLDSYKVEDTVDIKFSIYSYTSTGSVYDTVLSIIDIEKVYIEPKKEQKRTYSWEDYKYQQTEEGISNGYFKGCITEKDIKRRYRTLSKKYHGDMPGGDDEVMKLINQEFETVTKQYKQTV